MAKAFEPFPIDSENFLRSFYLAKKVAGSHSTVKIAALKKAFDLEDAIVTVVGDADEELRAWEFYILTKLEMI
jgi:hypothetical protein